MTDYCKLVAKKITMNVYECLGCENLIRTDCSQYESKAYEATNIDFDEFFRQNHDYKNADKTVASSEL